MKLEIYEHSQNYTAQVIKLPIKQSVQGLDNLVRVTVFGNDCLIGKDSPEDELYLFFPAGTQLSEAFVNQNNLYRESQLNADILQKGFFEPNRRVKSIKFKGIISTGFVISLRSIFVIGVAMYEFKEGLSFNEIDGYEVCRKYVVPITSQSGPKGDKVNKINARLTNLLVPNQFRFHAETNHLANHLDKINIDDIVVITNKWHGSSCILSKVHVVKKLTRWQKILNILGAKIPAKDYGYIYSSGKPKSNLPKGIVGEWINNGIDYYSENIWQECFDEHRNILEDGISIYGEIVGFTKSGSSIQKDYDYGCEPGDYKFVVYRITYTKPDGNVIEFSWQQIKEYCAKYGLESVKEYFYGSIRELLNELVKGWDEFETEKNVHEFLFEELQKNFNLEQMCNYCVNKVPAEGIVLRIDGKEHYNAFKLKSKLFLKKESDELDKCEINIEDNA